MSFLYIILHKLNYFNYFYIQYEKERHKNIIG
jgi:hypothetical protein